jgi:lysophospholipase L1-like esterase
VKRTARIALSLAFGLLFLEIALRIYNPLPFRLRGEHIVLPRRQSYTFRVGPSAKLDAVVHHTKNSLGFRGPEPPRDWARRLTVFTVGGSTTECLFLSDGRTWTDQLARRLASVRADAWVNNAGLDGQSTFGHLVLMGDVIGPMHPRIVLFLVGINDVARDRANTYDSALSEPTTSPWRRALAFGAEHVELLAVAQNVARARHAREAGFGHSEVVLNEGRHLVIDADVIARDIERQRATFVQGYVSRLKQLVTATRADGSQPVLITQPALYGESVDPTTGVDLRFVQPSGGENGLLGWRLLELYNDGTRQVGRETDVPVVDLASELPKDSRYFYDYLHYSNAGAERVGDLVFEGLARSGLIDQK